MAVKEFVKELNGSRVEGELVKTIFYSLVTSFIIVALLYFFKLRFISDFFSYSGLYLLLAVLSYSLIIPTIRQVRAYKNFACMSGMMIGMTVGMISGFLVGFFVGAVNGMFVGGVFGMFVGMVLGVWLGTCCGVMGFMEGMMAGLMGGWMGSMTAVMLLNDHLVAATIIIFLVSAVLLLALNYMVFLEAKESPRQLLEDHFITILVTLLLTSITIILMAYAPRGFGL
ncbi:hypothetical protein COU61_01840 [Candidatus Pacearchaeota archaeon CG10_big_fil_rev_8_21_14_0_10_35_13]|nr:MAG: hypothetical protein COU61_01840 [Candidatus Pacearchaeota archaeon CG10_big_fil_rev_8_21_14_0_10_35_13]